MPALLLFSASYNTPLRCALRLQRYTCSVTLLARGRASSAPEQMKILGLRSACRAHDAACLLACLAFAPCTHCYGIGDKLPGASTRPAARASLRRASLAALRYSWACIAACWLAHNSSNAPLARRPLTALHCPLCCFSLHCWLAGGGQSSPVSAGGDKLPGGVPPGSMKNGRMATKNFCCK